MKLSEVMAIIGPQKEPGFMVSFERVEGRILRSDYFPDNRAGEKLIATEAEAWDLARKFAAKLRGKVVNLYVVNQDYVPVPSYKIKLIRNR